jgi:hypothetical protein
MMEDPTSRRKSTYYTLIFFSLIFVAVFIVAGLLVKTDFGSGARPAPTTGAKPPSAADVAGHYVGFTTISTGICSVGSHEFALDIDEDGNVKSAYAMKSDKLMSGRVNPEGKLRMNFRDGGYAVSFDGELKNGHIAGHSSVSGDRTCDINWDLWRN